MAGPVLFTAADVGAYGLILSSTGQIMSTTVDLTIHFLSDRKLLGFVPGCVSQCREVISDVLDAVSDFLTGVWHVGSGCRLFRSVRGSFVVVRYFRVKI